LEYDGTLATPAVQSALSTGGLDAVRYPGGSYADGYHWQTNTEDGGGFVAPNTDFDHYTATVRAAGAQAIVTANCGSGTPQEAAAWVQYSNVTKGYGVKYWEIGNGEYGASWEGDNHSSHSATTYATNLLQYISAMKAVDPSIKIGAVLTTPASWPDGIVGPGDTQVSTSSSTSLLSTHAVKRANGDVDVMLINKDPNNDASVSLSYNGFTPGSGTPTVYSYLKNGTSITSATNGTKVDIWSCNGQRNQQWTLG